MELPLLEIFITAFKNEVPKVLKTQRNESVTVRF